MNLEKIEKSINEAFENKAKLNSSDKELAELVREKGRLPKNPLCALRGDGCGDSITTWRSASMSGFFFLVALLFSPQQGFVQKYMRHQHQRLLFSAQMLTVQLLDHEGTPSEDVENTVTNMINHMGWNANFANKVTRFSLLEGYITREGALLQLTPLGREVAKAALSIS